MGFVVHMPEGLKATIFLCFQLGLHSLHDYGLAYDEVHVRFWVAVGRYLAYVALG